MNETMCCMKGTSKGDWGGICVIAMGDLYQLPPIRECPIYAAPKNINSLNDSAPNGWEEMMLHELTQIMQQNGICSLPQQNTYESTRRF